jgi:hypothetical protein
VAVIFHPKSASSTATPPNGAGLSLFTVPEEDVEEFDLPLARTVQVFDADKPGADAWFCQLTDSDDRGSDSESEGRGVLHPSGSSDDGENSGGSGGHDWDYDF